MWSLSEHGDDLGSLISTPTSTWEKTKHHQMPHSPKEQECETIGPSSEAELKSSGNVHMPRLTNQEHPHRF